MSTPQNTPTLYRILSWVVTLLIPVALVLATARLIATPLFLKFEYNSPGFPEDFYGFTKEDRLYWSNNALDYLLNNAGISFLSDLKFPDGSPLYNERELKHMLDAKAVVKSTLAIWYASLAALFILGLWAWFGRWWPSYRSGLARGGMLTVILVGSLVLFILTAFGVFFVAFHNLFFASGTWLFEYSDTLIRLFPERFWRDLFIAIGLLSLAGGLALFFIARNKK